MEQIFLKGVLSDGVQRVDVERFVFLHVKAQVPDPVRPVFHGAVPRHKAGGLRVVDPVHQVVFILKMVIKRLPCHPAVLHDVPDGDFTEIPFAHQFLQGRGESEFCDIRFRHCKIFFPNGDEGAARGTKRREGRSRDGKCSMLLPYYNRFGFCRKVGRGDSVRYAGKEK